MIEHVFHSQRESFLRLGGTRRGTLFITGSGASLLKNDLSLLAGRDVMCINDTVFFMAPFHPRYWIFVDNAPAFWRYLPVALFHGLTVFASQITGGRPDMRHENIVLFNVCDLPGHCDYCTLDAALGTAIHLGYSRVVLLGCDGDGGHIMRPDENALAGDAYRWTGTTLRSHTRFLDIRTAGPRQTWPDLPNSTLGEAVLRAILDSE